MSILKSAKDNPHCLICSGRVGVSTRNSYQIFSKETITCSERPLSAVMTEVLEENIHEEDVHSYLICKKCFKAFDEYDELEQRLNDIKQDLVANYKNSLDKNSIGLDGFDELNEKEIEAKERNKENQMPKKILDIPSSDDEDVSQDNISQKPALQTLEDIEMELVKIHGGENQDGSQKSDDRDFVEENQPIYRFKNDNSTDTTDDFDQAPDNTEALLEAAAIAEKSLGDKVALKSENVDDRPNILKRKSANILAKRSPPTKRIKEEAVNSAVLHTPMVARDGELYTCLLCEGDETVCGEAKAITQHIRVVHDSRIYICDVCGDDFRKRNELSVHLDEHVAAEEGDFQCEVCNRIFSNLRLFRIHKRMHYPQNKAWNCETCGKKYSSRNLLEEHINTHTGIRPYVCQLCGKDFASKYTFKAHEKTHEVRPRPFQCSQCHKTFLSHQNLSQHERTHTGIKEFSCHLCNKQFGSAHNLEVHSIVHTGYKPFSCGMCGKSFARKAEIRDHERTHTGERPYQCEFCGATFSQRSNLQSHKRATHYDDKRYKCDDCGKGFKRRRLLDYHIKAAHTGERPFKCNVCDATFVYPEHFKKHRRIHTGEKPFLCEVCGKAFNSRDNRNAHRFVHSDKKPYECLVCGSGFMRKPLLYQHMQAQGHLNDTIVVNQPRLTTDDDQIITVNADGEMEIVDGDVSRLESIDEGEDTKMYISQYVDGTKVIEHSDGTLILGDNGDEHDSVEHIIIDGQQIQFHDADDDDDDDEVEMDETDHILASAEEYEGILTPEALAGGQTQIIQTKEGPVQLVAVRIPNDKGEEEEAWIKIVPENTE